jgi:hypothetical protein
MVYDKKSFQINKFLKIFKLITIRGLNGEFDSKVQTKNLC